HIEKHIPLAGGLAGGSSNAAATLTALNKIHNNPLPPSNLAQIASTLGSDVPFFLQPHPAVAKGRGEIIEPIPKFTALQNASILLINPGFGVPTPWAYRRFSDGYSHTTRNPSCSKAFVDEFQNSDIAQAKSLLFNSLEPPVFHKYPLLQIIKEFCLDNGADGALLSGSGATVLALLRSSTGADKLAEKLRAEFGPSFQIIHTHPLGDITA
ncbi:MAG: 4-(cytidine 5'-diphospho)-2-C-methyl-D-erythritol kinase, partial [Verrucomicrobia bacterium]|nr:4-(cytidine 5'-diphospho)-2-C-methyl-D-erythritol kinase [Verrucomicrobiota bacterium]